MDRSCTCGAVDDGKWAGIHSKDCPVLAPLTEIEIWNDAIDRAADTAAAFDAAMNSEAMVPFAHDPDLVNAIYDRDFAIATRIRELKRVTPAAQDGGRTS